MSETPSFPTTDRIATDRVTADPVHLGTGDHAVTVDPPLWLAPMAGITDCDFRLIVRRIGGVGVVSMEFLSSRDITSGRKFTRRLMQFQDEERPLAIQIYGSDATTMADAARIVEELQPDLCDINMGCPANKVLKGCAGAALMGDLKLAKSIIVQVRKQVSTPLTVKFRLGLDVHRKNYLELGRICEAEGVDAVAMHARTAKQMYTGEADWTHIARLKEALSIPVIGNGDVEKADDAIDMFRKTGCDGVMIGRGATKNPWLFRQIAARLEGKKFQEPTLEDRRDLILDHFRTVAATREPVEAVHKMRSFARWYSFGVPEGLKWRRQLQVMDTPEVFLAGVEQFFEEILTSRQAA